MLTCPVPGKEALASRDFCGDYDFVSDALVPADDSVLEFFSYALSDIESCIDELEGTMRRLSYTICVSVIKTFIRGDRVGLVQLRKVLPSIFKTFCVPSPSELLVKCGLIPEYPDPACEFPSFFLQPDLDGCWMIDQYNNGKEPRKRKRSSEC